MEGRRAVPEADGPGGDAILLIDGHDLTRRSLAGLLERSFLALDVLQAKTVADAAAHAGRPIRVILFNAGQRPRNLSEMLHAMRKLGGAFRKAPIAVVLRSGSTAPSAEEADIGALSCISPAVGAEDLIMAVRLIIKGGLFIGPGIRTDHTVASPTIPLLPDPDEHDDDDPDDEPWSPRIGENTLTVRESEVLMRLRQGKPNKIIAHEMCISANTVKMHVRRILRKLHAANRTEAACLDDTAPLLSGRTASHPLRVPHVREDA